MTYVDALNYFIKRKHQFGLSGEARRAEEMAILALEQQINKITITLPCEVKSVFYIVAQRLEKGKYTSYFVDERQVSCFEYDGKEITIYDFDGIDFSLDKVFFDREEAQAKARLLNACENKIHQTY
jgi:hypothetical protein